MMIARERPAYFWLFVLVVAPIGAVVVVMALLLFGATPHTVFAPGFALKRMLHAPNGIGVAATVGMWWLVIVAVGLTVSRLRPRPRGPYDESR
jgi:uncharacterized membrane protein YhaH (DUF805 family)